MRLPRAIEYEELFLVKIDNEPRPLTQSVKTISLYGPCRRINPDILMIFPVLLIDI